MARLSLALIHCSTTRMELADANRWSRHAGALIERIDDSNAEVRRSLLSELASMVGTLHIHEDRLEEAEKDDLRAIELFETLSS